MSSYLEATGARRVVAVKVRFLGYETDFFEPARMFRKHPVPACDGVETVNGRRYLSRIIFRVSIAVPEVSRAM